MTWTYTGNPASNERDYYRFTISDTDPTDPIFQDEELDYIIQKYSDEDTILYNLFKQAALTFSRDIKKSLGPQSEDPTSRLNFYANKAAEYKARLNSAGFSNKCSRPIFKIGMHDNV